MTDFTKGDWRVSNKSFNNADIGGNLAIWSPKGLVAYACTIHEGLINAEANAHLIAAAPDMYEALESWEELWNMRPLDSGADMQEILERCWAKTEKARAKAEGRE